MRLEIPNINKDGLRRRLTSLHSWELLRDPSAIAPDYVWTNGDMDPTPPSQQTWTMWSIMGYWASDMINIGAWQTASSILAVGLSWREAIPCMFVGSFAIAVPMVLNGAIGARLHVPFSVISAASFGYYLRYFAIISRCILAMFWLGINGANGAQCVSVMLRAWAPSYNDIPNHLPASAGITTQGMCSYFVFWIIQLPLLLIHPTKLQSLFVVKLVVAPVGAIATMGWCLREAGGGGELWALKAEASGSRYAWLWISCMTAVTGAWSTLACNIPDFTRYARSTSVQYVQLPFIPFLFTACGVLGIVTTSCSKVITGTYLWNPLNIIEIWLDYGAGGRCAAFFAALAWLIASIGTNITANSISAANDITVLFPRWVNIKRGCLIAAVIAGWVFLPWKILSSAATFLSFMNGYSVFLGPISGVLVADYWLVKRGHYDIPGLYDPFGRYRYSGKLPGCNWRALVAFIVPVTPLLPGLALSIVSGGTNEPSPYARTDDGLRNLYTFNWFFGFLTTILLYTTLSWIFPDKKTLLTETIWALDGAERPGEGQTGDEEQARVAAGPEHSDEEKMMIDDQVKPLCR